MLLSSNKAWEPWFPVGSKGLAGGALGLAALKRFAIDGPPEFDPAPASLKGKTVVITGGNTGLGKESALRLAKAGATVVLTARSEEKGRKALADVKAASGNEDVHFLQLDLADLENVKSFKQRFTKEPYGGGKIDVLMNNAGVMAIPERKETKNGFEQQLGVNHLDYGGELGVGTSLGGRQVADGSLQSLRLAKAMDTSHAPSWLQRSIHATPVLVAQTLYKMKGQTPHIAFVGRSNVGKSTLLNMLLHRRPSPVPEHWSNSKKLHLPTAAPVSHTPGRTRHLFRFELGGTLTLVDLPGYGHAAKTPKEVKESWRELVDGYLTNADQLRLVVSLVDGRVGVKRSDEELWELLEERQRQLMVVLTKVDQCSPEMLNRTMAHVVSLLEMKKATFIWPYVHAVSGLHGHGVDELRASVSLVASDYAARKQSKKNKATAAIPQALTGELLPLLEKAKDGARVIAVSSTAHLGANKELMTGDLMAPERYTQWGAYCQSKLANVLFAKELDRKFKKAGINATAVSCHPGGVDTDLQRWTVTADGDPQKATQLRKDCISSCSIFVCLKLHNAFLAESPTDAVLALRGCRSCSIFTLLQDTPAADAFISFVTRSVQLAMADEPSPDLQRETPGPEQPPPGKRVPAPPPSLRTQRARAKKAREDEPHRPAWDDRHHLNFNDDNAEKPKRLRSYFSRPQSLPELRADVEKRPHAKSILKKLEAEEVPAQVPTFVSADAGPAVCPTRHVAGGVMIDRDGTQCPWNNRWQAGVHILNEQMHPLHRSSFATKSLFETAPSQRWRRHLDVQNECGSWRSMITSKGARFPPLGV
ncbi:engB [Symbiodinium sp. CCMP2592]|nr:engB [Symbiodinium sp. CCMP2592]